MEAPSRVTLFVSRLKFLYFVEPILYAPNCHLDRARHILKVWGWFDTCPESNVPLWIGFVADYTYINALLRNFKSVFDCIVMARLVPAHRYPGNPNGYLSKLDIRTALCNVTNISHSSRKSLTAFIGPIMTALAPPIHVQYECIPRRGKNSVKLG